MSKKKCIIGGIIAGVIIVALIVVKLCFFPNMINVTKSRVITKGGSYTLTGDTKNATIKVNTKEDVKLILYNLDIKNTKDEVIKIKKAKSVTIILRGKSNLSTSDEKAKAVIYSKPTVTFEGSGTVNLKAVDTHAIKSKNKVIFEKGNINIVTDRTDNDNKSVKGVKADGVYIEGGNLDIKSKDDAINSDERIAIEKGNINIKADDDGLSTAGNVYINGGTLNISKSKEGIEGHSIFVKGGDITVKSMDDAFNAAVGNEDIDETAILQIDGGNINIDCEGDGLDANGKIIINGGNIAVNGTTDSIERSLDCDGTVDINGGEVYGYECCKKYSNVSDSSKQYSVIVNFVDPVKGKVKVGEVEFTPTKKYKSFVVSSSKFVKGESYKIIVNGKTIRTVKISSKVTIVDLEKEEKEKEEKEKEKKEKAAKKKAEEKKKKENN